MIHHHSVMESTIKQPRRSRSLLVMGFLTLILMPLSLPLAQADTINYELTADSGFDAELTGTFSYDTMALLPITALNLVLTNSPSPANPPFPLTFNDITQVLSADFTGFTLTTPNPSNPAATIEVLVEAIFWNLGDIPTSPMNTLEYSFAADNTDFEGVSRAIGTRANVPAVPEPGTALLLATGLLGLAGYRWKQRHHDQSKD